MNTAFETISETSQQICLRLASDYVFIKAHVEVVAEPCRYFPLGSHIAVRLKELKLYTETHSDISECTTLLGKYTILNETFLAIQKTFFNHH